MNRKTATALVLLMLLTSHGGTATPIEGFPDATITIFPATYVVTGPVEKYRKFHDRLMGPAGREEFQKITGTLALLLEERGYDGFEMADTEFRFPTQKEGREDRAAAFGEFVGGLDLKTEYALGTEVTVHLEKSFEEIYTVIVDAAGTVVWEDSQGPGDAEFDSDPPGSAEHCGAFAYRRLSPAMALDTLPEPELSEEKKRELEEMRAGQPPSQSEFAAIEARLEAMKNTGGSARVVVYPARVDGDHTEKDCAKRLSGLLNDAGLCRASAAKTGPVLTGEGWPNEMEVLWRFAQAARRHARRNPVDSDYTLFADYWFAPNGNVWAVHFVICDRAGDWVLVDMQNNHHEDFQRVGPKNVKDCDRLVSERLAGLLR